MSRMKTAFGAVDAEATMLPSHMHGDLRSLRAISLINGKVLSIGMNLRHFLRRLQAVPDEVDRWLWADAICINQSNVSEKSSQVAAMGNIFEIAAYVKIWLGEAEQDSNHAFDTLRSIGGLFFTPVATYFTTAKDPVSRVMCGWRAFAAIVQRPYWATSMGFTGDDPGVRVSQRSAILR
jgi:hypothetical protein